MCLDEEPGNFVEKLGHSQRDRGGQLGEMGGDEDTSSGCRLGYPWVIQATEQWRDRGDCSRAPMDANVGRVTSLGVTSSLWFVFSPL